MADDDDLLIRLRALGARPFKRDVDKSARSLDNFGDQAGQAARKLGQLNKASAQGRVNIGPVSTSARVGAVAVGALALATGKAATSVLGLAEATATLAGGAGVAGGVGLTALGQGMGVVTLATQNLSDALSGNEDALAKLTPAQAKFVGQLQEMQPMLDKLRGSAAGGLLGGAGKGIKSASANFGVLNRIIGSTSKVLGGLAEDAGKTLGSKGFGQDLGTLGAANVHIIDDLGHSTLDLADAARDLLVEGAPLAQWLAKDARAAAALTKEWIRNKRETGELSKFFRRARQDLALLGSAGGHGTRGLINLFGAQDVDGTKTLRSLDQILAKFEEWSKSPAVKGGVGQAVIDQIPKAAGGIASALAKTFGAAAPLAAQIFLKSFLNADAWGKILIGGVVAKKLGLGKIASKAVGGALGSKGPAAGLIARGSSPANPMWVRVAGTAGLGGKGGKLGSVVLTAGAVFLAGELAQPFIDKGVSGANSALNKARHSSHRRIRGAATGVESSPLGALLGGARAIKRIHDLIPGLAGGGTINRAGSVMVGERGPEMLSLPRGAQVNPLPAFPLIQVTTPVVVSNREIARAVHTFDRDEKARNRSGT